MSYRQGSGLERRHPAAAWGDRPGGAATFLFRTASFVARPDAVAACMAAVEAYVLHVNRHEGGTPFMSSFQDTADPSRFLLVMVFEDERAERAHRSSLAYRRFAEEIAVLSVAEMRAQHWTPHAGL